MSYADDLWKEEILAAIERGDMTIVFRMVTAEPYRPFGPEGEVSAGFLALIAAIYEDHVDVVEALHTHGVDLHQYYRGRTPLSWAIGRSEASVRYLLSHDADLRSYDDDDDPGSVLEASIREWQDGSAGDDVAHACLEAGTDPNLLLWSRCPVLVGAADFGRTTIARDLLEHGADVNLPGDDGETALMLAAREGCLPLAKLLLSYGADPDAGGKNGSGPLREATLNGHTEIERLLVNADARPLPPDVETELRKIAKGRFRADVSAEDESEDVSLSDTAMTPDDGVDPDIAGIDAEIWFAVQTGDYAKFLMLLKVKPDIRWNMPGPRGTLFAAAVKSGCSDLVRYFLEAGADPNWIGTLDEGIDPNSLDFWTLPSVLGDAVARRDFDIIRLLIETGADVTGKNRSRYGLAPFDWLETPVKNADLPMLRLFLDTGVPTGNLLYAAANKKDVELVRWLLGRGIDINAPSTIGMTAFMGSILALGSLEANHMIDWLLERGADINYVGEYGDTALKLSVTLPAACRKLLDRGADPNTGLGDTALMAAVRSGREESVSLLLDAGADVHAVTQDGDTALRVAQSLNAGSITKMLLDWGARKPEGDTRSLHAAVLWNRTEEIRQFIHEGADVEIRDFYGRTPLLAAVRERCSSSVVEALLEAGADPCCHVTRDDPDTALLSAVSCWQPDSVRLLMARGVEPNADNPAFSPLLRIVQKLYARRSNVYIDNRNPETRANGLNIVRALLEAGASPDVYGGREIYPPLQNAAFHNDVELIKILVEHGAKLNMYSASNDRFGDTALHLAVETHNEDAVRCLLECGAEVDIRDDRGETPLRNVCSGGYHTTDARDMEAAWIAGLLLSYGADVNSRDNYGWTPLMTACCVEKMTESRHTLIRLLLDAGADVNAKNESDCTSLHYAKEAEDQVIIYMLIERGAV